MINKVIKNIELNLCLKIIKNGRIKNIRNPLKLFYVFKDYFLKLKMLNKLNEKITINWRHCGIRLGQLKKSTKISVHFFKI